MHEPRPTCDLAGFVMATPERELRNSSKQGRSVRHHQRYQVTNFLRDFWLYFHCHLLE